MLLMVSAPGDVPALAGVTDGVMLHWPAREAAACLAGFVVFGGAAAPGRRTVGNMTGAAHTADACKAPIVCGFAGAEPVPGNGPHLRGVVGHGALAASECPAHAVTISCTVKVVDVQHTMVPGPMFTGMSNAVRMPLLPSPAQ